MFFKVTIVKIFVHFSSEILSQQSRVFFILVLSRFSSIELIIYKLSHMRHEVKPAFITADKYCTDASQEFAEQCILYSIPCPFNPSYARPVKFFPGQFSSLSPYLLPYPPVDPRNAPPPHLATSPGGCFLIINIVKCSFSNRLCGEVLNYTFLIKIFVIKKFLERQKNSKSKVRDKI